MIPDPKERNVYLLQELRAVPRRIMWHQIEDFMPEAHACAVALVETWQALAGLDEHPGHASCFDPDVTEAIKRLIDALNPRLRATEQAQPQKEAQRTPIRQASSDPCVSSTPDPLSDFS